MATTSSYQISLTKDIVEVLEIGESGARCRTSYKSIITIGWSGGIPSHVPQVGEIWVIDKLAQGSWIFISRVLPAGYNLMRYSMSLDMSDCVGRERAVIDDLANSGVSEIYLTVAKSGRVYWASGSAASYHLEVATDSDGDPIDLVRQVVDRCVHYGLGVTFVFDCELWNDTLNVSRGHYEFQQVRVDERRLMGGWIAVRSYEWGELRGEGGSGSTWGDVKSLQLESSTDSLLSRHQRTMTFPHAVKPVTGFVAELYSKYKDTVRGICFSNWQMNGAYSDVSDYMVGEYLKFCGRDLVADMANSFKSDSWWERRMDIMEFYADVQRSFLDEVKKVAPNWACSVIVPSKRVCVGTESCGRYETWLDDDFATYGWSMVGCKMEYTPSTDEDEEMRSLEFDIACMKRFSQGSAPLYVLDISKYGNYAEALNILAKYDATNVLLSDYPKWRSLSDKRMIELKNAMNTYSVSKKSELDDIGIYLSSDSYEVSYMDDSAVNRFPKAAQECSSVIINRLPHRLRILYDGDMEDVGNLEGMSTILLFNSSNMSDKAIDAVNEFLENDGRSMVFVGRCGMRPQFSTIRQPIPFLGRFGMLDGGDVLYYGNVRVGKGFYDIVDNVYELTNNMLGVSLIPSGDSAAMSEAYVQNSDGSYSRTMFPLAYDGRSSVIAADVLDNYVLMELVGEMALYAIGRDA